MTVPADSSTVPDLTTARRLARRFADQVRLQFGDDVDAIRLFGSAARGDWLEESDVDVLLVMRDPAIADAVSLLAHKMGVGDAGILLRPLMLTRQQFDELVARERRIALDIQQEGIDL